MGGTSLFGWMEPCHFDKEAAYFLLGRAKDGVGLVLPGMQCIRDAMGGRWLYQNDKMFKELAEYMPEYHRTGSKLFIQLAAGMLVGLRVPGRTVFLPGRFRRAGAVGFGPDDLAVLFRAAEDQIETEQHAADRDEDVREIKDAEPAEKLGLQPEHIHHVTEQPPVDAVADGARHRQYRCPPAESAADEMPGQRHNNDHGTHHRQKHEEPARAGENAQRGPVVMDVHQLDYAGNQRPRAGVQRHVGGDPVFEPLISDQDKDGKYGIQHGIHSCSKRPPRRG